MDDLKLATEEQLRKQWVGIQQFIDEYRSQMTEEEFEMSSHDYLFDDDHRRQGDIFLELQSRGLLSQNEKNTGYLDDPEEGEEVTSECPSCGGTKECSHCKGRGHTTDAWNQAIAEGSKKVEDCPICEGSGQCQDCLAGSLEATSE